MPTVIIFLRLEIFHLSDGISVKLLLKDFQNLLTISFIFFENTQVFWNVEEFRVVGFLKLHTKQTQQMKFIPNESLQTAKSIY